ncbi:MAG: DUF1349 domain-containing protein [Sphingobacteriales bacterium]|nr:MAG: DUF1349 domain-containing protein [Sphingobacteriales bacterium]
MKITLTLFAMLFTGTLYSQNLNNMQWFNQPEKWEIGKDGSLSIFVTPATDYWRITHYGFTVDDAPFYYGTYGGEFEVKVKIEGDYKQRFDQMGLMLRADHENWIKAGIEFVDGKYNVSAVVTHKTSDWSVIELQTIPPAVWIKAVRRLDAIELFYSFDDVKYTLMRVAHMQDNAPLKVGMMGASPDGKGFKAVFKNFKLTPLPDKRRLEWLEKNKG